MVAVRAAQQAGGSARNAGHRKSAAARPRRRFARASRGATDCFEGGPWCWFAAAYVRVKTVEGGGFAGGVRLAGDRGWRDARRCRPPPPRRLADFRVDD